MKQSDDQIENLYVFAKELADHNSRFEEIEKQLSQKTDDSKTIAEIITRLKKVKYAVSRKNGLTKIGFGAMFLVIGFFITCINFHSNQSFTIVMYSTSSVGLILIFWGLYDIIG